jgi:hypothetical protein
LELSQCYRRPRAERHNVGSSVFGAILVAQVAFAHSITAFGIQGLIGMKLRSVIDPLAVLGKLVVDRNEIAYLALRKSDRVAIVALFEGDLPRSLCVRLGAS